MNVKKKRTNEYIVLNDSEAILVLINGERVKIDTSSIPLLKPYRWVKSGKYPATHIKRDGERIRVALHNLLATKDVNYCLPLGTVIDHIDGDRYNYHYYNLRYCTQAENTRNRALSKNNKTGYKGVNKRGNSYVATITKDGKRYNLGSYEKLEEAVIVRYINERILFGEFYRPLIDIEKIVNSTS